MPFVQVNTNPVVFTSKVMHHVEGGWPKEVDYTEAEHVIRYRKKVQLRHAHWCVDAMRFVFVHDAVPIKVKDDQTSTQCRFLPKPSQLRQTLSSGRTGGAANETT